MASELRRRVSLAAAVALYTALAGAGAGAAGLPVPCAGGTCAGGPSVWVTQGTATAVTNPAGTRLDINQASDRAVLNWAEFNVDAGNTVNFNQPGRNSLALNKIFQGDPSRIFGSVTANGQVYLVNQNGILFGRDSQVNVGALVASSLALDPEAESGGILNPALLRQGQAALQGDGRVYVLDASGQVVTGPDGQPIPVRVSVEAGAKITSATAGGGSVILAGQQVENAGRIESPSGQVVLAAGQKVYLQASEDPDLRGLLVEVDAGGTAWNRATGEISSTLGNVSLVGLAVNQDGRVSATTSVQSNGSVRLLARDTVNVVQGTGSQPPTLTTSRGGSVVFGAGSRTEVGLDAATADKTAVEDQVQPQSAVEVVGRQVTMQAGSTIRAAGGSVALTATANPSDRPAGDTPLPPDDDARIRLEAGSLIDVSGSEAEVDLARNLVRVELRTNELRDAPVQRDGALRGETVFVDSRVGTPVADVSGATAAVPRTVQERTAAGGTVSLVSRGDVVLAEGATIDVSGGAVNYRGGVLQATRVVGADGTVVDIGVAAPDKVYQGVNNPTVDVAYTKWGVVETRATPGIGLYTPGYVEGRDAGTVQFAAPRLVVNGILEGGVRSSEFQRTPATAPVGGRLIVGLPDGSGLTLPDFRAPSISLVDSLVPVAVDPDEPLPGSWTRLELPTRYLTEGGFTRTELYSNGVISLGPGPALDLAPGSELSLRGAVVDVARDIRAPGGAVSLSSVLVNPAVAAAAGQRPGVRVAADTSVDVSGRWVNDLPEVSGSTPAEARFIDAGRIDFRTTALDGELVLGDRVNLRADGGAALGTDGAVTAGRGGSISLQSLGANAALATGSDLQVSAFAIEQGGSLTLGANRLLVGGPGGAFTDAQRGDPGSGDNPFRVASSVFREGGFASFRLVASGGRAADPASEAAEPLTVTAGASIEPQVSLLALDPGFRLASTGTDLRQLSSVYLPTPDVRPAASVAFAVTPHSQVTPATAGDLLLAAGSTVRVAPGGSVAFTASSRIRLDGTVVAPGGAITASLVNPPGSLEQGFDPAVGIFVGGTGVLDARGVAVLAPNSLGLRQGRVLDGGMVGLNALRGRVELAAGSIVDVSGTSAVLDLPAGSDVLQPVTVASRGGRIDLVAPEGLRLDGNLAGAAGGPAAEGGTLALGVSRLRGFNAGSELLPTFPTGPRQIRITTAPAGEAGNGVAELDPARVAAGGFDSLVLQADDEILFATDTALAVRNRLALEAPNLRAAGGVGSVSLAANHLAIGPRLSSAPAPAAASGGGAGFQADAGLIDLFGRSTFQGFGTTVLAARTDIRATGLPVSAGTSLPGSLGAAGSLTLQAAQVYPTTFSDFRIDVSAAGAAPGALTITGNGAAPGPVLSAAGKLRLAADTITQAGTVVAPLGQIDLVARDSLTLAAGSLTSTSAGGRLLPFGRVTGGTSWTYESVPGITPDIAAPPEKRVRLEGAAIAVAEGAVLDLSGGGDLYAYEFLPGPGGSVDALAPGVNPNLYAVLPGGSAFAPWDTQEYQGSSLRPGDSVRLDGVPGLLEAGEYALLPARYALLPGAVLVEVVPGVQDLAPGQLAGLPDGTPVVAGVRTVAGTTIADSRTTGFAIRPGSYARQLAEYRDSFGNDFFTQRAEGLDLAPPPVARDAGTLQLLVGDSLDLRGTLDLNADTGDPTNGNDDGRGGRLDLSAASLRIVEAVGSFTEGVVEVAAGVLNRIAADSVLLGGTRTVLADRTELTPVSGRVEVAEGLELAGSEYLLLARDEVVIAAGATVRSTGGAAGNDGGTLAITGSGGSALVRVSRDGPVQLQRASGAAAAGDLTVGEGAVLGAAGSVTVDAGGTARSFGSYELGTGSALALGSSRVVLGAEQSAVTDGLALDDAALVAIGGAAEVLLRAGEELLVAGPAALGDAAASPGRLTLDAPVLRTAGAGAAFTGGDVILRNTSSTVAGNPAGGSGELVVNARQLRFGGGDLALDGFGAATLGASGGITTDADAILRSGADLTLAAPVLTGAAGTELVLRAPGREVRLLTPAAATPAPSAGLGAALDVDAARIEADTRLLFPAGRVRLAADDSVLLGDQGLIDVAGRRLLLAGAPVDVAGGTAQVVARTGDVELRAGSRVDVSTGTGTAGAGRLDVLAGGAVNLAGSLAGQGPAPDRAGSFGLTAVALADFGGLNAALNEGGFLRQRAIETLTGDLVLGAGTTLEAQQVSLAASGGNLVVAGRIDARAPAGGRVELAARDNLALVAGSEIDARATVAGEGAGRVKLASVGGDVTLESGSRIRLDGAAGSAGGELLIRAAATGDDLRVTSLGATIEGALRTILVPVLRSSPVEAIDAAVTDALRSLVDAFMAVAPATIRARLGAGADTLVRPGLEVGSDGDLVVSEAWDLAEWRWDDQPGYLTLRAPGNLAVLGDLSDGFLRAGSVLNQLAGDSWSFELVAGADTGSALTGGVLGRLLDAPDAGTLELGDGVLVRTGTGDLRLAAAGDLVLAGSTTAVYTAGVAARQAVNVGIFRANWSRDGGDISLAAGRDISAVLPSQVLSRWNVRNLGTGGRAQWAVDYGRFRQGVAALAGGTVDISAGRDIRNLSATVATTSGDIPTEPGNVGTWGGGDLRATAGRDLLGGTWSTWSGDGSLVAGRSVGLGTTADGSEIGATLAAGAGRFTVSARQDLDVGGILNPTVVPSANPSSVYFYTWSPDDALDLTATGGLVRLRNDLDAFGLNVGGDFASLITAFGVAAPTLRARAASGDVELVREVRLLPSPTGQAEIIAAGSVRATDRSVPLLMSDADPATLPTAARPTAAGGLLGAVSLPSDAAIHADDDVLPALLIAATGDILGGAWQFAKPFRAVAGGDVRDLSLFGQNNRPDQYSLIQAGRDIDLNARDNPRNSSGNRIELAGPGRLQLLAGRNVSLGFSRGITTLGNTGNARLPAGGAALDVWVGLGGEPAYDAFNTRYWDEQYAEELERYLAGPDGSSGLIDYVAGVTDRTDLDADSVWAAWAGLDAEDQAGWLDQLEPDQQITFTSFVDLVPQLVSYTNLATGRSDLAATTAADAYLGLDRDTQRPLVQEFFFRELRDSGRLANLPRGNFGFDRGKAAVTTLFPEEQPFAGDLSLLFSRLYTLSGGDISLLAPGGLLNVGLAQPPANLPVTKQPSDLGIVAQGPGSVRVFSAGDVLVNQSRIFTLAGGDILIWSSEGDIDAGRGSKSAISAPPPVIRVDANGQVTVEFSDAIAGSGIRGILTSEDSEAGDVDLIAPSGTVNAGDAGIGAAGNLNIAAPQVVGLDNIQVGGISAGVPTDSGAAAGLTGVSSLSSSVANAAEAPATAETAADADASLADDALGWLEVFIEGFGDGDDDEDERRRGR